ncbi:class I SAM-dependent methyltransferase [Candidatus Sumerlaeota bacterium]|nr:class I SAM-dependent methyltransferase [Candidatus Sumerlaeota bacterium]
MEPTEYERMFELEDHHWWFQGRYDLTRRMLDRHCPALDGKRARLLDIGCGTGLLLEKQQTTRTTFGLDFSRHALHFSRLRGVERLVCGDSQALPFASESFDMVTAFDLVEHVEGDQLLVAEVHRVLRPGGIFLATVPAHPFLWSSHDLALHHKRRYRWDDFNRLFDERLWIKRRMTWTFALIYPVAAAVRSARKLIPRRGDPAADTHMTAPWLNSLLIGWHHIESAWAERFNLPFGLSIMTVREKSCGKPATDRA